MDGLLRCSRYAFGPNRLHYCGPDATGEILSYLNEGITDPNLSTILSHFQTLYPYLKHIAEVNHLRNPFDERVVEAYWIGNSLLDNIPKQKFFKHLIEDHRLKKRLKDRDFMHLIDKIPQGAMPYHAFHVLNIWQRTGATNDVHTLESLDACRISWGKVVKIDGPKIIVKSEPLLYLKGHLSLGSPAHKTIIRSLEVYYDIEQLKIGQIITFHWHTPCEVITPKQAAELRKYTLRNIALANQTI